MPPNLPDATGVDLTELSPSDIDSVLSQLWAERDRYISWGWRNAAHLDREKSRFERTGKRSRELDSLEHTQQQYQAKIDALNEQMAPYEAEFGRRGGWNRYYLVTNAGGHVHRGRSCVTCFETTSYAWLPALSGCDEEMMIEEYGEKACTVCFPDAPSYPAFAGPGRLYRAERDARAAIKAERDRVRAAKAITNPDGTPLRTARYGTVATERTAEIEYVSGCAYARSLRSRDGDGEDHRRHLRSIADEYDTDGQLLLRALAHKRGRTVEDLREQLAVKVDKKYRRDYA